MYLTYRMLSKLVHYKKLLIKKFLVKSEPITITSQDILNEQANPLQSESQRMYYKIPPPSNHMQFPITGRINIR